MTERERLIDKAKKIAAMMQSSSENEVSVAAAALKRLLDEHHLSMSDLGSIKKEKNYTSPPSTSKELVVEEAFLKGNPKFWIKHLVNQLGKAYGVRVLFGDNVYLVGMSSDVEILRFVVKYIYNYISDKVRSYGYTTDTQITSYASGVIERIVLNIKQESYKLSNIQSKALVVCKNEVTKYVEKKYGKTEGIHEEQERSEDNYSVGLRDGSKFTIPTVIGSRR